MIHGTDISHHQGAPQFPAMKAAGHDFVVLKATESTNFVDPRFAASRAQAHAAGLVVGLYHFARAGDPGAEAAFFVRTVGSLAPGEFAVLDWEVPAADPVGWCSAWLAAVRQQLGVKPLLYLNRSTMQGHDWSPVVHADSGLWLASYDGSTDAIGCGCWPGLAMKQYTDKGSVPGISGPVDLDVFYGSVEQLRAYGASGAVPPPPPPGDQPWLQLPSLHYGDSGPAVRELQNFMVRVFPAYNHYTPTGNYLDKTAAGIAEFQRRTGIGGDGREIAEPTKHELWTAGFHG